MELGPAQGGGLVADAGVPKVFQLNRVSGGERRRGDQAENANKRQQQSRQALMRLCKG